MARWAHVLLGLPVWFEFSFVNADKPAAYLDEICQRLPWTLVRRPPDSHADLGMKLRPHGLLLSGNVRFLRVSNMRSAENQIPTFYDNYDAWIESPLNEMPVDDMRAWLERFEPVFQELERGP